MMKKTILKVEGMTCGHCKSAVEEALKKLEGVKSATVNLEEKTVAVEYNEGETDLSKMKEAVEDQGYDVA